MNQMQLLSAMQKDPRTRQQISGLLQQMGGGVGGIGQPLGQNAFNTEENTLMNNPITAPNGLTKDVLKSLMVGNVGEFAPPSFTSTNRGMGYPSNDMPSSFSNGPSGIPDPRKLENLVSSFSNQQQGAEGFPTFPKFNFGGQSGVPPLLRARHHHHRRGHANKEKSGTVTKLLLSLLVDKLKDIYEMDKYTANGARKQKLNNQETTGKIEGGLRLDGVDQQTDQGQDASELKKEKFQTNLTFPLTVSDSKAAGVKLVDSPRKVAKKNQSDDEVDSDSIDKIIKGIEANQTAKLNLDPSKPVVQTGVNREIKDDDIVIAQSPFPGAGTVEKNNKVLEKEEFLKNPDAGSFAEFHTIKMPLMSEDKNVTVSTSEDSPVEPEDVKTMLPVESDGREVEKVTSLPSFSVSSLLNKGKSASVAATDRVLSMESLKSFQDMPPSSSAEPSSPKDANSGVEVDSEPKKGAEGDYLEASRVLGSVYNRVKDPLAKKSVETAIRAMLKLLRSDSPYSKKENVPSSERLANSADDRRADDPLRTSVDKEPDRAVKNAEKRGKLLKNVAQRRGGGKINTRSKLRKHHRTRRERKCECGKPRARVLRRKRKSTRTRNSKAPYK